MSNGMAAISSIMRPLALILLLPSLTTHAIDINNDLSINGFYGLHLNTTDTDNVRLPRTKIFIDEGDVNYDYSLLGLQADYSVTDNLSLTVQSVISKQTSDDYQPRTKWAYLSYDFGNDLSVRAGKFLIPFMQGTELHYIGFSRTSVRPLVPSSGAGGFDEYVGGEIIKSTTLGDYELKFQGALGVAKHQLAALDEGDMALVSARLEKDTSWINFSVFQAKFDIQTKTGYVLDPDAQKLMANIEAEHQYDDYLFNFGYVVGDSDTSAGPDETLAYASLGYRAGHFTPYLLYQYNSMKFEPLGLPRPNSGGNTQANRPPPPRDGLFETSSYAVGVRYDLGKTYAIKAQWEYQDSSDNSNAASGIVDIQSNILTVVLEGVF